MIKAWFKRYIPLPFGVIIVLILFSYSHHYVMQLNPISLTDEERHWLSSHPKIIVAPSPFWPPIDIETKEGKYEGLSKAYMDIISKELGITFQPVFFKSNVELYEALKNKVIDVAASSAFTLERANYAHFTNYYLHVPVLILARSDFLNNVDEKDLVKYKVSIGDGFAAHEVLKTRYPAIQFLPTANDVKVIEKVATGEADLAIVDVADASNIMATYSYSNLKVVGQVNYTYDVAFAVRDDYSYLLSSMNKVLVNLSESRKNQLYEKWIHIETKPFYKEDRFIISILSFLALISIVVIWNITLSNQVRARTSEILELNASLEKRVEERTRELTDLNTELDFKIDELMATQNQLVEAERYALLGRLVSGLAHKLNTPVGNLFTTISYQAFIEKAFKEKLSSGVLSTQSLNDYLNNNEEAFDLCMMNIEKIKKIVADFKRLEFPEVDLDSVETFSIKELIYAIISEVQYSKNKPITFQVDCSEDLTINSYYMDLKQIVMNLLSNAYVHGFGDHDLGLIKVTVEKTGHQITITIWNNGAVIPNTVIEHMYKPFYTTDLMNYSGLGLSVVINLIKNRLLGSIVCKSSAEKGTEFVVEFIEVE